MSELRDISREGLKLAYGPVLHDHEKSGVFGVSSVYIRHFRHRFVLMFFGFVGWKFELQARKHQYVPSIRYNHRSWHRPWDISATKKKRVI